MYRKKEWKKFNENKSEKNLKKDKKKAIIMEPKEKKKQKWKSQRGKVTKYRKKERKKDIIKREHRILIVEGALPLQDVI